MSTEKEKIKKYNAIAEAKAHENLLRKYVMMAKGHLDKACSSHCTLNELPEDDLMTAEEVKMQTIKVIEELKVLNEKIFTAHNDVYIITYINITHWWYELWNDFLEYVTRVESFYVFQKSKLEKPFNLVWRFTKEASGALDCLQEWNKPFLFEKYI